MKKLLLLFLLMAGLTSFAQGIVTGTVVDPELGGPLPGANVIVTGTTNGVITDFDGNFTVNVNNNKGSVSISYVGYEMRRMSYTIDNGTAALGSIALTAGAASLDEVIIIGNGVINIAEGRRTPIAVSTITAEELTLKAAGNVEFTESFKNTPSVYVANQGSGFGDSQVFLRGFDDTNTAFLLNGQPINSPEDGRMFWSNWSGMSDVANAVQVQRGLGASKLAISSVGGTVNIVSKTTDKKEGGFVRLLGGNDSYFKGTINYNSGMSESGWGFSVLLDHWQAHRKFAVGTEGQGQTYMFSVGYKASEKSIFNFLITGAPQYHDQNFGQQQEVYNTFGGKHNPNSGFLDGERFTERRNYYHKPVANLNWDYELSEKTELSTVLYASWGRGGGTGGLGSGSNRVRFDRAGDGTRDEIDFETIRDNNINRADGNGNGNFSDSYIRRSSVNNHNWYGLLSNLSFDAGENWDLSVGADARLYKGDHFRQVNDLLGLNGFTDNFRTDRPDEYTFTNEYAADPWSSLFNFADEENRTQFDYSENINYIGGFGQAEYATDHFSAFFQGALSSQSYQRTGRFTGVTIDGINGLGESEKINKIGYNLKGGLSYTVTDTHTFFVNGGYYSRQPYLDNIFADIRNSNALVKPDVDNEQITSYEAGYRFNKGKLRVNIDIYRTEWGNRFVSNGGTDNVPDPSNPGQTMERFFTDRFTDVTQIHQGLEFDFEYRPDNDRYRLKGYGSIGNWKYDGSTPVTRQDEDTLEFITIPGAEDGNIDLTGTKVGQAPQTSFGVGLVINAFEGLSIDVDYNVFSNLYAQVDASDVAEAALVGERFQSDLIDSYGLFDLGLTYKFNFGGNKLTFRGNVFNAGNESFVTQQNNFGVGLGNGRTYNGSIRYNF
ncbi:TonB-dependent receptor [Patiriisocius sp. Uisw_017]|jgi:hypothetical protein|uniref:TonB-dependent receptor n=1 Tax=Patiriisocius sp. Uisw_017 TaxID=3230968 RepID=UPI0039E7A135